MSAIYRAEWERVALVENQTLTVSAWRQYQAEFELCLNRVADVADWEVEKKIEQALHPDLRKGLKFENLRRQEGQFWVKFAKHLPAPLAELESLMKLMLKKESIIFEKCHKGYVLNCGTSILQDEILNLDGWKMRNGCLKVSSYAKRMSMAEIFRWVHGQLTVFESEAEYYPSRVRGVGDINPQSQIFDNSNIDVLSGKQGKFGDGKNRGDKRGTTQKGPNTPPRSNTPPRARTQPFENAQKPLSNPPASHIQPRSNISPRSPTSAATTTDFWTRPTTPTYDRSRNSQRSDRAERVPKPWRSNIKPPVGDWEVVDGERRPRCILCRYEGRSCFHDFWDCYYWQNAQRAWEQNRVIGGEDRNSNGQNGHNNRHGDCNQTGYQQNSQPEAPT